MTEFERQLVFYFPLKDVSFFALFFFLYSLAFFFFFYSSISYNFSVPHHTYAKADENASEMGTCGN